MKTAIIVPAILVAATAASQVASPDVAKIALASKEGDVIKHKWELTLNVAEIQAVAKATLNSKVVKVEGDQLIVSTEFENFGVLLDGTDPGVPVSPQESTVKKDGTVLQVVGGIEGGDPVRTYLLMHFVPPTKDLAVGETYEQKVVAQKDGGIPAFNFKGKYVGKETVKNVPGFKFETTLNEDVTDGMEVTNVVVVAGDGRILKLDSKFVRLPLPIAGQTADGKITAEIED